MTPFPTDIVSGASASLDCSTQGNMIAFFVVMAILFAILVYCFKGLMKTYE